MRQLIGLLLLTFAVQPMQAKDKTSADCEKNVSFAVAEGGQIVPRVPAFADKWISKNQKKYAGLCFSQAPNSQGGELPVGIFDLAVSLQRNLSRRKNQHQHEYQHDTCVRQRNCHRQLRWHVELHLRRDRHDDNDNHNHDARRFAIHGHIEHVVPSQL